jgi:Zn-dependent protease with chaperone function
MRFAWILLAVSLLAPSASRARGAQTETPAAPAGPSAQPAAPPANATYTLTAERRAKAIAYSHAQYVLYFVGTLVSIGIYLLLWRGCVAVLLRNWARKASRRHFIQCLIFVPLFVVAVTLLNFPLDYYSDFVLEHRFGLSTQGFASWLADWGRNLAITGVLGVILAWVFYAVARRSPRRWWFYFWLASIPIVLAFLLIQPDVIEPLFNKFTPLQRTQPALVGRMEAMLKHACVSIPPARIFEMDASSRTKAVDAYVSGLGLSKRVVVWDTTLKKMGPDELLLVLGHETGHYVLHHIPKQFALDEVLALLFFLLGSIAANRLVERVGPRTGIEGVGDLASLPLILAVLTMLVFLSSPIANGISRHYEHQADQFGLEVAHGVVPDPNAAEVQALQILGEEDLADPDPSPFIKFWLYTHPPLEERIRFAASYKPWAEGKPLELLPHRK